MLTSSFRFRAQIRPKLIRKVPKPSGSKNRKENFQTIDFNKKNNILIESIVMIGARKILHNIEIKLTEYVFQLHMSRG